MTLKFFRTSLASWALFGVLLCYDSPSRAGVAPDISINSAGETSVPPDDTCASYVFQNAPTDFLSFTLAPLALVPAQGTLSVFDASGNQLSPRLFDAAGRVFGFSFEDSTEYDPVSDLVFPLKLIIKIVDEEDIILYICVDSDCPECAAPATAPVDPFVAALRAKYAPAT